jgi:hypothetical protein
MSVQTTFESEPEKVTNAVSVEAVAQKRDTKQARKVRSIKKKGRIKWGILGGAVAGALTVGFMAHESLRDYDDFSASSDLPRAVAEYRASGMPFTANELAPRVAGEENAAPYLAVAGHQTQGLSKVLEQVPSLLDSGQIGAADQLTRLADPAIRAASLAVTKPRLDYNRDWDEGPLLALPEFANEKFLEKAISYRAQALAAQGNSQAAANDILVGRKIAALVGQEPIVIGGLVSIACDAIATDAAARSAPYFKDNVGALRELEGALSTPVANPNFATALRGEAYMQVVLGRNPVFQDPRLFSGNGSQQQPHIDASQLQRGGLPSQIHARALLDRILNYWAKVGEFERAHPNDPIGLSKEIKRLTSDISSHHTSSYRLMDQIWPEFQQTGDHYVKEAAQLEVTRALIEALIYHADTGRYPQSVAELPGSWIDPFTGKPLKLVPMKGGIRIYSLGEGQVDHGGLTSSEMKSSVDRDTPNVVASFPSADPPVLPKHELIKPEPQSIKGGTPKSPNNGKSNEFRTETGSTAGPPQGK